MFSKKKTPGHENVALHLLFVTLKKCHKYGLCVDRNVSAWKLVKDKLAILS